LSRAVRFAGLRKMRGTLDRDFIAAWVAAQFAHRRVEVVEILPIGRGAGDGGHGGGTGVRIRDVPRGLDLLSEVIARGVIHIRGRAEATSCENDEPGECD